MLTHVTGNTESTQETGQPALTSTPALRRRSAAVTREAVLLAAREVFTRLGYDRAGIREIAAGAGIDARLIGRYFGSKEKLFAEVVDIVFEKTMMMGPGQNHAAAHTLLASPEPEPEPADGMLMALRSASSERAVAIMRDNIESRYQSAVAAGLPGPHAAGRAALLIAVCSGVQLMRNVIGSTVLAGDNADELVPYLEAALDAISATPAPVRDELASSSR
jgi:AcrR family transcriptional regulator